MGEAVLASLDRWGYLVAIWAVLVGIWVVQWRINRRDRRRWDARDVADRRRWALQAQLRQVEDEIREERLSDEEREWRRRYREEQAEVKREARRRLGLPKEE
jgi:hypothetical protein